MRSWARVFGRGLLGLCALLSTSCAGTSALPSTGFATPQGSGIAGLRVFFVGTGVEQVGDRLVPVGQARVEHLRPVTNTGLPVILYPGLGLSGAIYLGTPDGRAGWAEHFVAAGHPVYVYEPVDTGPSGIRPDTTRLSYWNIDEIWERWGFGPQRGVPYADTRFPIAHIDQFYAAMSVRPPMAQGRNAAVGQSGQDGSARGRPGPAMVVDPNVGPLTELLRMTGPAVVIAHSWASHAAEGVAADNPELLAAVVLVEPASCPSSSAPAASASIPRLMVYGDRLESRGQTDRFEACALAARSLGQDAQVIHLPELGIHHNGHIMMQEDNSEEISKLITDWINQN